MNLILEPSKGMGALYLGNLEAASNLALLHRHNIKSVLTVAGGTRLSYRRDDVHYHEVIPADDIESYDLSRWFDRAIDFIDDNRRRGYNVLVHCFAGVSRSATIIIAYLMSKYNWNYDSTTKFVRDRRPVIFPNFGFVDQLRRYERSLGYSNGDYDDYSRSGRRTEDSRRDYAGSVYSSRAEPRSSSLLASYYPPSKPDPRMSDLFASTYPVRKAEAGLTSVLSHAYYPRVTEGARYRPSTSNHPPVYTSVRRGHYY
eukprot:TRINITY_DN84_c0_g1_i2.p1 TRINITY_DN84_c0_g1~~TRINITY_DN84_c0_g1_i2.p1  ORF type:complete len:257 (+),score=36.72 TRINITY_DN84_c0_g1_i2:118-888(+)